MASTPVSANLPPTLPLDANVWENRVASFVQAAERRRSHYLRLAHRVTPCHQEAEDIVQDALLRAFRNLPQFRGEAQMTTWLQSIVQNAAREWLRERRGVHLIPLVREQDSENTVFDIPEPSKTPEEHCQNSEMRDILLSEIGNLSSACREALLMCAVKGASQEEAANALEVSVAAIKARMFIARRQLREGLQQRGINRRN
jgi:RNA polymerase sigma-70 factor, ECF subfamily